MPSKKERKKLRVVKIPLDYIPEDIPAKFPPMPMLYLELLENKQKIKPELRNKEYIPRVLNHQMDLVNAKSSVTPSKITEKKEELDIKFEDEKKDIRSPREKKKSFDTKKLLDFTNYDETKDIDRYKKEMVEHDIEERDKERREHEKERKEREEKSRGREEKSRGREEKDRKKSRHHSKRSRHTRTRTGSRRKNHSKKRRHRGNSTHSKDREKNDEKYNREKNDEKYNREKNDEKEKLDPVKTDSAKRLEELLKGKKDENSNGNTSDHNTSDYSKTPDGHTRMPPRLSDIEKGEVNTATYKVGAVDVQVKDMTHSSQSDEQESVKKREILFKFDILRRSYKGAAIPEYTEYTDLGTLQKSYDDAVRRLSLDSTVESYKKYLIYGFMAVEWVLGGWFKFDMSGFTQQQLVSMDSYERLLIELGEKSYLSGPSNWPVEIRLLLVIVMNAAFFIVSKMIMSSTGTNFMNMMTNQIKNQSNMSFQPQTKKKMRGPDVNLSDLGSQR